MKKFFKYLLRLIFVLLIAGGIYAADVIGKALYVIRATAQIRKSIDREDSLDTAFLKRKEIKPIVETAEDSDKYRAAERVLGLLPLLNYDRRVELEERISNPRAEFQFHASAEQLQKWRELAEPPSEEGGESTEKLLQLGQTLREHLLSLLAPEPSLRVREHYALIREYVRKTGFNLLDIGLDLPPLEQVAELKKLPAEPAIME